MKKLLAGGFLFVGGAIIMTIDHSGQTIPWIGGACAFIGLLLLVYSLQIKDDSKE